MGAQNLETLDDDCSKALVVKAVSSETVNSTWLKNNFVNSVLLSSICCMMYEDSGTLKTYKYI